MRRKLALPDSSEEGQVGYFLPTPRADSVVMVELFTGEGFSDHGFGRDTCLREASQIRPRVRIHPISLRDLRSVREVITRRVLLRPIFVQ